MSAEPVKIPLAVKKDIRDAEPKKLELLAEISALVGSPVTLNFELEKAFAALAGHSSQLQVGQAILGCYLEGVKDGLKANLTGDDLTKDTLNKVWTTKVLTFTIEPEKFKPAEGTMATNSLYNGWRIQPNGDLDIFIQKDRWYSNTDYIYQVKFSELLAAAPGDLPLEFRKDLGSKAAQIKAVIDKITKATGVEATWDIEADAKAFIARADYAKICKERRFGVDVGVFCDYLGGVADCLVSECADEMVKEAVADIFKGKVGFTIIDGDVLDKVPMSAGDNYARIQFVNGEIRAIAPANRWASNVDAACSAKIVQLF